MVRVDSRIPLNSSGGEGHVMFHWIAPKIIDRRPDCDRTTSKMRGLSPKIISVDSQRSENV
jgi:hypothetical protein